MQRATRTCFMSLLKFDHVNINGICTSAVRSFCNDLFTHCLSTSLLAPSWSFLYGTITDEYDSTRNVLDNVRWGSVSISGDRSTDRYKSQPSMSIVDTRLVDSICASRGREGTFIESSKHIRVNMFDKPRLVVYLTVPTYRKHTRLPRLYNCGPEKPTRSSLTRIFFEIGSAAADRVIQNKKRISEHVIRILVIWSDHQHLRSSHGLPYPYGT